MASERIELRAREYVEYVNDRFRETLTLMDTSVPAIAPLSVRSRHYQSYFKSRTPLWQARSRHPACGASAYVQSGAIVLREVSRLCCGKVAIVLSVAAHLCHRLLQLLHLLLYATKKAIYVFTTFYIYLILRCSTVGRWRSLVLSLNGIGIASRVETRQTAERSGRGRRIHTMCVTGGRRA
jgi:hypothetical protein